MAKMQQGNGLRSEFLPWLLSLGTVSLDLVAHLNHMLYPLVVPAHCASRIPGALQICSEQGFNDAGNMQASIIKSSKHLLIHNAEDGQQNARSSSFEQTAVDAPWYRTLYLDLPDVIDWM